MENSMIKIILANDHSLLLNGITQVLDKDAQHVQIVANARDFKELLLLLNKVEADILMTDDVMPHGTILAVIPIIKERYPHLKIIVSSMYESFNPISVEVKTFVQGWISYTATKEEFVKAIDIVYAGHTYL